MKRFLYYFPGVPGINPQMMASFGVLSRFVGIGGRLLEHVVRGVPDGPGGSGCVVAMGAQVPVIPPDASWLEGEKFWVCAEETVAPGPADLVREVGIGGYDVKLLDGNGWRVPLVWKWDGGKLQHAPNLPQKLIPIKGKVRNQIRPEYLAVDAIARRCWDGFCNEVTIPLETAMVDAAALLAVNYRLGVEEAGLLGLFDAAMAVRVLSLAIDLPKLHAQADTADRMGLLRCE